jgi:tRNA(adenine34) deaminase
MVSYWCELYVSATWTTITNVITHDEFMLEALVQARLAEPAGEVPIGAVVVLNNVVVGRGYNQPISAYDPTAHAEIMAIRDAARTTGNYRLTGAVLYVTIEPCLMCVGAFVHARIGTVVYGAAEPRSGSLDSTIRGADLPGHNHRFEVVGGVRADECRALMQAFFKDRRSKTTRPT